MNELAIRELLQQKLSQKELTMRVAKKIEDPSISWEEKRPLFHFLYNSGQEKVLVNCLKKALEEKERVAFDLIIELAARANLQPGGSVLESLFKGIKKQGSFDEVVSAHGWDKWDSRLSAARDEWMETKLERNRERRDQLLEKFEFLRGERMTEQAGRELKRLVEIYPEDPQLKELEATFAVDFAREVLASHMSRLQGEALERTSTRTQHSPHEEKMLASFLNAGEKIAYDNREFALDLAIAFWFMEDYNRALEILEYAPPGPSAEWMRAETLFHARRFVEALEQLNMLEVKYVENPESMFAVSYLRAQCLQELGQQATALEILQSIVRVRAQYRSAHALILKWTSGASWE